MEGEHLDRVSSPSIMSQSHFHQTSAEVTPSVKELNLGSSMDSGDGVGFGPPPAFPQNKSIGKRKLTLVSVSAAAGFRVGDDPNSEDESNCIEGIKQPQLVHRIKGGARSPQSSRGNSPSSVKEEDVEDLGQRGKKRHYNDAMILASLSDVGSPKGDRSAEEDGKDKAKHEYEASPKSDHSTSSTAGTPLRSNVNAASDGVKPFALLPKPYASKRGKLVHEGKKEDPRDARPPPHFPGPYGGYPYPPPHGPPPPHPSGPYAGYPYPYQHHPPPPPPPPGSMPPPSYYGMHAPPTPMPPTPEYWGQYHSPETATEAAEAARSGAPPFHPLSSPVKSSHVVPTDESDPKKSGHPHPGLPPPYGHSYPGPPPPGYPGYYPPPSIEYKRSFTVSVDESSPSRHHHGVETSPGAPPPRPEMHPSSSSPQRPGPPPGHHPDSPYSGYPPPHHSGGDPYQTYDYASASPTIHYPPPHMGNYQFRKGGRSIHSEPIILKKKFSWRNYPEVRYCSSIDSNLLSS